MDESRTVDDQGDQAMSTASSGHRWLRKANEIIEAKTELKACEKRCRECQEELAKLQKELDGLVAAQKGKRGEIPAAKQKLADATAEYDKIRRHVKTWVYENSRGQLTLSATKTGPAGDYKGWMITPERARRIDAAQKKQEAAKTALKRLHQQIADLEKEIARKRRQLEAKRKECETCRKHCKALRDHFVYRFDRWLDRLGDDRSELVSGEALDKAAVAQDHTVRRTIRSAGDALRSSTPAIVSTPIPNLRQARPFSATYAAGKSRAVLADAARVLAPHEGSFLVSKSSASRVDAKNLQAMASGRKPTPKTPARPYTFEPVTIAAGTGTTPTRTFNRGGRDQSGRQDQGSGDSAPGRRKGPSKPAIRGRLGGRTDEAGTGNILGGAGGVGGSVGTSKRATGGSSSGIGSAAQVSWPTGAGIEAWFRNDDLSRWERVKELLRRFVRAYVNGDLGGMTAVLSSDFTQDVSLLMNAAQGDFKYMDNRNVDIELLTYRMTFFTVMMDIRWFVTATEQATGNSVRQEGTLTLLFNRLDGLRIMTFQGQSFVGIRGIYANDWQTQSGAGDPNVTGHGQNTGGGGQVVTSPVLTTISSQVVGDGGYLVIDLDTGASGIQGPFGTPIPPYDIALGVNSFGANGMWYLGEAYSGPFSATVIGSCGYNGNPTSAASLLDLRNGPALTSSSLDPTPAQGVRHYIGVLTSGGRYALVEIVATPDGLWPGTGYSVTFDIRYYLGPTSSNVGVGGGTQDCP